MKTNFPHIGLAKLCGWFGISRQAYYQNNWEGISKTIEEELVLKEINSIRKKHCRIGTRKLFEMIQPFMLEHSIKMGRDALFSLLAANDLLVRKRKTRITTTNSFHWLRRYPNLIRELVPTRINELWVSDITYWKMNNKPFYISFVTDAYSRKIVGYQLAETLEAIESIKALQMALSSLSKKNPPNLIHHSDRGIQYCSHAYVKQLKEYQINISMTENGDPLENAIAERVNGIIKDEYLNNYQVDNMKQAKELLKAVVELYNNERPHMSISNQCPNNIHNKNIDVKTERLWKNYYRKQNSPVNQEQD